MRAGKLYVLSGPSGVGKDTVLAALQQRVPALSVCITATTRAMRPGESQGNPYQFLSVAEFESLVRHDAFLEYARVNGNNLYGTPRAWVEEQRAAGKDVLLKIDVQGGITVREKMPDAILVFLEPPSMEELERRLRARSTEDEDAIRIRLMDARSELAQRRHYDYAVFNDTVDAAAEKLAAILTAEACRIPH